MGYLHVIKQNMNNRMYLDSREQFRQIEKQFKTECRKNEYFVQVHAI